MVALDFDIVGQKKAVDGDVMKIKEEIARVGRILFRLVFCLYAIPYTHRS